MRRWAVVSLIAGALSVGATGCVEAQENDFLAVGTMAPDIEMVGATRYGVVGDVSLSSFRGETVVLAFFFRARTRG